MNESHNPYFNRWFSAIECDTVDGGVVVVTILILIDGFLQYNNLKMKESYILRHNPYFNRWFSAIAVQLDTRNLTTRVTILILIDGFLQSNSPKSHHGRNKSQSLF